MVSKFKKNYYVDLVFYNRLLQCYVLIDLKTDKLSHQDLGQMQMYVNYYDRFVKQDFEKPTIGILLCESKNDALVALSRDKDEVMRLAKGFLFEAQQKRFTFDEDNYYVDLVFYNRLQSLRKTTLNNIFNL